MNYGLLDAVGIVGAALLMVAYFLLQVDKLQSNGLTYSLLNAIGALLIVFSLLVNFNLAAFLIEVFWILISLIGIVRYLRPRILRS